MLKSEFNTGNVLKTKYGSLIIITSTRTNTPDKLNRGAYYNWVSFDSYNCSGGTYHNTTQEKIHCFDECGDFCTNEDCETCGGTGVYMKTYYGLEDAEFLASCVKYYILDRLTKNFDF